MRYHLLGSPDTLRDEKEIEGAEKRPRMSRYLVLLLSVTTGVIGLIVGFMVGHRVDRGWCTNLPGPSRGVEKVVWERNLTFTGKPRQEWQDAWLELLPDDLGFILHPEWTHGEERSVTVFHQLHCLVGPSIPSHRIMTINHEQRALQVAYHKAIDGGLTFQPNMHINISPVHTEHCFDYLRQGLMCSADTNLEVNDFWARTIGTTTGRTERQCRDFRAVVEWAQKWKSVDGKHPDD
ncbi:uncharacterized protein EI97DRAFT_443456 [Westerdykella ornata]|uniref:Uncharacterized protein n=1 Tax=Westerdykella ornata TaxID=318751 RepID=A0A6A6JHV0_WESOR|nr:uncharacterized protein EI97DRAFT_443456 [Westerdykella ornata]KAF2275216.1 hypothetical protein EI97DRAFT_443456 [Westerdykella ornata]